MYCMSGSVCVLMCVPKFFLVYQVSVPKDFRVYLLCIPRLGFAQLYTRHQNLGVSKFYCLRQGTSKRGEGQPFLSCRGGKTA